MSGILFSLALKSVRKLVDRKVNKKLDNTAKRLDAQIKSSLISGKLATSLGIGNAVLTKDYLYYEGYYGFSNYAIDLKQIKNIKLSFFGLIIHTNNKTYKFKRNYGRYRTEPSLPLWYNTIKDIINK